MAIIFCLVLTLDKAIELGLSGAYGEEARIEKSIKGRDVLLRRTSLLPKLSLNYTISSKLDKNFKIYHSDTSSIITATWSISGEKFFSFLSSFSTSSKIRWEEREELGKVAFKIVDAFFTTLTAKHRKKIALKRIEMARELLKMSKEMWNEGMIRKTDLISSEMEVIEAEVDSMYAEEHLRTSVERLKALLGIEENIEIEEPKETPKIPDKDSVLTLATLLNPSLCALRSYLREKQMEFFMALSSYLPTLSLSISRPIHETSYSVSFSLSLPLFTGLSRTTSITSAKGYLGYVSKLVKIKEMETKIEVEKEYSGYLQAKKKLELGERMLELARINMELNRELYKMGEISHPEYLKELKRYREAELQLMLAKKDLFLSAYRILILCGRFP